MTSAPRGLAASHWRGGYMGAHHEMTQLGFMFCAFSAYVLYFTNKKVYII